MKHLVILIAFVTSSIQAQVESKQDYVWIFGRGVNETTGEQRGYKYDFNKPPYELEHQDIEIWISSMNASISDKEGNLLFFTNGCEIHNSDFELMENGDSLNFDQQYWSLFNIDCRKGYPGSQDVLIIPSMASDDLFYIFHKPRIVVEINDPQAKPLLYSIVDMSENNGKGKVITKNQVMYDDQDCMAYYLTGINHANQQDFWLIQPLVEDSTFVTYLVNSDGIHRQPDQNTHQYFDGFRSSSSGTAKFSPDGTQYALYNYYDQLHLYDFDRETGLLSNHQKIIIFPDPDVNDLRFSSVEWSSNSRFIYTATKRELHQIDTWETDIVEDGIRLIDTYNGTQDPFSTTFFLMAQAPDCKIYMCSTNGTNSYHVINSPDELGVDCDFVQNGIQLPHPSTAGSMPNFPRFRVDEEEKCDPTIVSVFGDEVYYRRDLVVYPSPSNGRFAIELPEDFSRGRLVVTGTNAQILRDVEIDQLTFEGEIQLYDLPEGIYNIEIYPSDNKDRIFYSKQVVKIL